MGLKIEYLLVELLKPYGENARKHAETDIKAICESIREFGFSDPIGIWGTDNIIVEGHGRLLAAKALGMETVPVIRLDHLTDEQRRAYALAHNKTAELSEWDFVIRDDELAGITEIDMSLFGFDIAEQDPGEAQEDDYAGEVPEEPKAKLGDLYQLGNHRLICGDSTDATVIDRLMNKETADICITSPPYGESGSAGIRDHYVRGNERRESLYIQHDDKPNEWDELMRGAFECMRNSSKAQFINIQMLAGNKRPLVQFINDNAESFVDVIVWDKGKAPPQMQKNVLNNQFEFIFVFSNGNNTRTIPFANFQGNINNVIELTVGHNEFADVHRAVYPVELPAKIMGIASGARSVLDVFGGTGTTLIACEQLKRRCFMCELDPHYIDVIIDRWEKLTGKKAVLLSEESTVEKED